MLCDNIEPKFKVGDWIVLILILMEYALWRLQKGRERGSEEVLILILMEYALWLAQIPQR